MRILFINLKLYKSLLQEFLEYNNYIDAKITDFMEWIQLRSLKSTSEYFNWWSRPYNTQVISFYFHGVFENLRIFISSITAFPLWVNINITTSAISCGVANMDSSRSGLVFVTISVATPPGAMIWTLTLSLNTSCANTLVIPIRACFDAVYAPWLIYPL